MKINILDFKVKTKILTEERQFEEFINCEFSAKSKNRTYMFF